MKWRVEETLAKAGTRKSGSCEVFKYLTASLILDFSMVMNVPMPEPSK